MPWIEELKNLIKGDVATDEQTLEEYSSDASIFEVRPKAVVFPKDGEDLKNLVKFTAEKKDEFGELSLAARSGGTDMSGGPLSESIVVEFDRYFNKIKEINAEEKYVIVQPGVYYRDFEREALKHNLMFPSYPASKSICALGGMIANNAGGEKSLRFGKTNKYVRALKVVLSDGEEYEVRNLSPAELQEKKAKEGFEGGVYRKIYQLLEDNFKDIQGAKPRVSKNSAGYALWNVWNRKNFDLAQLFVGSQGTLGLVTEIELALVKKEKHSRLLVVFLKDIKTLSGFVNVVLPHKPESLETFDDNTLKLGMRFLPEIAKKMGGRGFFALAFSFIEEFWMVLKRFDIPKFITLVEITGDNEEEIEKKLGGIHSELEKFDVDSKVAKAGIDTEKYWTIRRESFNLLRHHVGGKRTAPFIDDIIVEPGHLPEFMPKLYKILEENGISPTLAGHAGSGNFHIIPLMDLTRDEEVSKIPVVSEKVYDLVLKYGGSITAEHNDGLIRSPYLEKMYGSKIYGLFQRVKDIFDPKNIFNPGKKVDADLDYAMEHIKTK